MCSQQVERAEDVSGSNRSGAAQSPTACLGSRACEAARETLGDAVDRVRDIAQEIGGRVEARVRRAEVQARQAVNAGRGSIAECETQFEERIRTRPISSILLATTVGAAIGLVAATLLRGKREPKA